ncbi:MULTISPECIES: TetR/AcrR family transcriptional regulator [unclassified Agromyces]|uniref:TetR/AcrR family transcriptional regulator n=1 Tax=unclassified Agromyces TaxID=2639701 RepID=UPI003014815E
MPTPTRITPESLRAAAREVLERDGRDGLTMQAVASSLGVRAPSLYKHVRDRDDLVRVVAEDVARDLAEHVGAAVEDAGEDATSAARALAAAARRFAHERPNGYALVFGPLPEAQRAGRPALDRSSGAVLDIARRLVGDERALEAARTLTAWMHGFTSMELAGAFRLGGDVERAWEFGLEHVVAGLREERGRSGS